MRKKLTACCAFHEAHAFVGIANQTTSCLQPVPLLQNQWHPHLTPVCGKASRILLWDLSAVTSGTCKQKCSSYRRGMTHTCSLLYELLQEWQASRRLACVRPIMQPHLVVYIASMKLVRHLEQNPSDRSRWTYKGILLNGKGTDFHYETRTVANKTHILKSPPPTSAPLHPCSTQYEE